MDFTKYNLIKGYDGFIDREAYFYKVKKSSILDGHTEWAKEYIKRNFSLENEINRLLKIKQNLLNNDPVFYLINMEGFIYYSHNFLNGKPIICTPNPRIDGKKASNIQLTKLMNIQLINGENPFEDSVTLDEKDYFDEEYSYYKKYYGGWNSENK